MGNEKVMTKRYGMSYQRLGKKNKKDHRVIWLVFTIDVGAKAQTKYRWKSKWGVDCEGTAAKAAAKDIGISDFRNNIRVLIKELIHWVGERPVGVLTSVFTWKVMGIGCPADVEGQINTFLIRDNFFLEMCEKDMSMLCYEGNQTEEREYVDKDR